MFFYSYKVKKSYKSTMVNLWNLMIREIEIEDKLSPSTLANLISNAL